MRTLGPLPEEGWALSGDRGFESCSLHRRVNCEPDFLELAQEPAAAALPVQRKGASRLPATLENKARIIVLDVADPRAPNNCKASFVTLIAIRFEVYSVLDYLCVS
jgi:hypothetical protein